MIKRIDEGNNVSGNLPPSVDEFLQDVAQMYGGISYTDIMGHHYSDEDIRKLNNLRKRAQMWSDEMDEDEFEDYMNTKIVPSVKKIFSKVVREGKTLTEDSNAVSNKFTSTMNKVVSEIEDLEIPLDEGTEDKVFEGFTKLKDAFVKSIEDYISLLEESKDEASPSIRESDAKLINDLKSLIK